MNLAIVLFFVFFLLLTATNLRLAILFIIATLPSYLIRFQIWVLPTTLLEMMILSVGAVWFIAYFIPHLKDIWTNRRIRTAYPFSREIIAIIIISFIAAGLVGFNISALGIWKAYFFESLLLFLIIFNVFKTPADWQKLIWALLVSALAVSVLAIYQKATGLLIANDFWAQATTRRVVSWFGYPNAVGLYLAPIILILVGQLSFKLTTWKNNYRASLETGLIILTIICSILAVYFARSEGALVAIITSLIVFGLLAGKRSRLITLISLVIISGSILSYSPTRNYLSNKLSLSDLSGEIRQQQWRETLHTFRGWNFITGNGLANYQTAVQPYHQAGIFFNRDHLINFDDQLRASAALRDKYWQPTEIYLYPHNFFLNFWSELGLIGALIFTWIVLKQLFITLKLTIVYNRFHNPRKYFTLGLLTAMLAIIIHGLIDVPYFKNDLAILFWLLLALTGWEQLCHRQEFGNHQKKI